MNFSLKAGSLPLPAMDGKHYARVKSKLKAF